MSTSTTFLPTVALFARAIRDDIRSKHPVIIRIIAVGFLVFLIYSAEIGKSGAPAAGRTLLTMIAMVNFVGLTLYGLGSFPSAITEEKEDETLGLMTMTRLGPISILLGKGGARLTGGLLFLSVQIPFTILCVALGGTGLSQILKVYAILGAYLFFLANLGLLCSVISASTSRAVMMTLIIGLILYVLPFFLWFGRFSWSRGMVATNPIETLAGMLVVVNPIGDLWYTLTGGFGSPIRGDSIGFHLIGGCVCLVLARLLFERFCGAAETASPKKVKVVGGTRSGFSRPWRRALAWRDFHFQTGGSKGLIIRFVIYSQIVIGILVWITREDTRLSMEASARIARNCAIAMFVVEFSIRASRMFGVERRAKTLGSIFILPITVPQLAFQKLAGNALALVPAAVIWIIATLAMKVGAALSISTHLAGSPEINVGEVFAVAQFILFLVTIIYLSLRMRRGALLLALLAAVIGNIIVELLYYRIAASYRYSYIYSQDVFLDFRRNFYLTAAFITVALAIVLAVAIPPKVAACAAEE